MKSPVKSPANYSKARKSIINICNTFIYRISEKQILSSCVQDTKCRKKTSTVEQNFLRFSVTIARRCTHVTNGLLQQELKTSSKMLWFGHTQKFLFVFYRAGKDISQNTARERALAWCLGKNAPDCRSSSEMVCQSIRDAHTSFKYCWAYPSSPQLLCHCLWHKMSQQQQCHLINSNRRLGMNPFSDDDSLLTRLQVLSKMDLLLWLHTSLFIQTMAAWRLSAPVLLSPCHCLPFNF